MRSIHGINKKNDVGRYGEETMEGILEKFNL
jgi:hypothetical protein